MIGEAQAGMQASKLGFSCQMLTNPLPGKPPLLIAERIEHPDYLTLLTYGHGDVTAGQEDLWQPGTQPWALQAVLHAREGRLSLRAPQMPEHVSQLVRDLPVGGESCDPQLDAQWGEAGLTTGQKLFGCNTLEIVGLSAGSTAKPVGAIPGRAEDVFQLRFVEGTDWQNLAANLRAHLNAAGFADVEVRYESGYTATCPWHKPGHGRVGRLSIRRVNWHFPSCPGLPDFGLKNLLIVYKMEQIRGLISMEVDMTAQAKKASKADNPHIEAAERFRQLAQILAGDAAEAKAFRIKTGVYNLDGQLKAAYR